MNNELVVGHGSPLVGGFTADSIKTGPGIDEVQTGLDRLAKVWTKPTVPMFTHTGRTVNLNAAEPSDFYIMDIAHALSHLCRYNGHCKQFYSVAEHSVHLANYVLDKFKDAELAKCMLLHDATEAYVGDMISNLKNAIPAFQKFEDNLANVIFTRFGVVEKYKAYADDIHTWDKSICIDEMKILFNQGADPRLDKYKELGIKIECWPSYLAKQRFLELAIKLGVE